MTSKIFYGAGANARKYISQFIERAGEPVCFADDDVKKHYTRCDFAPPAEGIEILPLGVAIEKYPDYELWLTQAPENLLAVTQSLIEKGIPKERIHYCEDVVWRRGCRELGSYLVLAANVIQPCCTPKAKVISFSEEIQTEESLRTHIKEFCDWLDKTLELASTDLPIDCDGCSKLTWRFWPRTRQIKWLNAGAGFKNTICNCRCIYCNQSGTAFSGSNQVLDGYDVHSILYDEFGDSIEWAAFSDGEITVLPHRDKMLNLFLEKHFAAAVCTNAILYNEKVAEILKNDSSHLDVSLDSGTAETYHKIKGIDVFGKV